MKVFIYLFMLQHQGHLNMVGICITSHQCMLGYKVESSTCLGYCHTYHQIMLVHKVEFSPRKFLG